MSATNYTTNLNLSQFGNTDMPAWRQDYNGDMLKIDNAYTADISGATAETSADPSDYMKFYDVSATTNKKILISDLLKGAKVEDLTDTDITTPVDDDGLVYDATAQKWENVPIVTQEMQDILGAKNLFPNEATTQTINGITFTVNADKSVTLNGTSTQAIYFILYTINSSEKNICKAGKRYKISGYNPADASLDWGYVYIVGTSAYSSSVALVSEFDGWEYDSTKYVYLFVREGKTLNNIIVKPMITIASQPNSDYAHYVPYAKTNRELTEKVVPILIPSSDFSVNANASIQTNWSAVCGNVCQICLQLTTSAQINAYTEILSMSKYIPFGAAGSYAPLQCIITKGDTVFVGYASYANNALSLKCQSVIPSGSTISINFTMIIK